MSCYLTRLGIDRDVRDARVGFASFTPEAFRLEAYLIVQQHNELTLQPLFDIFLTFADARLRAPTHLELNG